MKSLSLVLVAGVVALFVWGALLLKPVPPREVIPSPDPAPKVDPIDYIYIAPKPPSPFVPKVPGDGLVPIGDPPRPKPTMCRLYTNVGKTVANKTVTVCAGRHAMLLVYKTNRSAKSLYYSWKNELAKLDRDLKKDKMIMSVSVLDYKNVDLSHFCTESGKH